jgi:putative PIN family toxin of toxin-antitoxin system
VNSPCGVPDPTLKVVLDTCVLKLATLPNSDNPAALIVALVANQLIEMWVSPAILEEYSVVLARDAEVLAVIQEVTEVCFPLDNLRVIRHEPDNRFVECALAIEADFLVTVNTARGHFDRKRYGSTRVLGPGEFVSLAEVQPLLRGLE